MTHQYTMGKPISGRKPQQKEASFKVHLIFQKTSKTTSKMIDGFTPNTLLEVLPTTRWKSYKIL